MTIYDIGDRPTVSATFSDADGAAADPTTVTLRIRKPDATVTVVDHADLQNPEVGVWEYDVDIDADGNWWYRFEGTGAVTAAEEAMLVVRQRRVPVV